MSTSAPIPDGDQPTATDPTQAAASTVGLGPQPARTDRPRDAALRVLRSLAAAEGPVTITALTAELGGHPNSVRMHLEHLVSEGFAVEEPAPTGGRGRPPRAYRATVAGLQVAGQDDTWDGSSALVAALAEQFATGPEPVAAARELGRRWGRRLRHADAGLLATLAAQGFTPRTCDDGIELRTCPLLATARQLPQVVCSIHQGLIDELSDDPLRLLPFARPGACVLRPVSDSRQGKR
ncbi:helix-turn-helix domain-containing protein [Micropruina sp.]|jgi:predicted ArsR family transcriptional regulator|uniref:helix-turn-helix transcriptional regulator n=1 Tax=Micropruina sp. TaxID=2737536 RepID=UPI002606C26D|nr:helix-turn-helix domain-containing protein [Micropruina sp.]